MWLAKPGRCIYSAVFSITVPTTRAEHYCKYVSQEKYILRTGPCVIACICVAMNGRYVLTSKLNTARKSFKFGVIPLGWW